MNKIKLTFVGTAAIGSPLLETLSNDERFEIAQVITQADRPAGRKMELQPSPIKQKALALGLPVFQPENINESIDQIEAADLVVLMAYGQILKEEVLEHPRLGCVNVHASILPKHRGASPIQQSLLHRDEETGISIMKMVEKMDAGPIYATSKFSIEDNDNAITLHDKLAALTATKVPDILYEIVVDELKPTSQDHHHATYCRKIHKTDGAIDWNETAEDIETKIKAFAGWPGTHCFWNGRRLKITEAAMMPWIGNEQPGTVILDEGVLMITCKKDALQISSIQMEGKTVQSIQDFIQGYDDFIGSVLD